MARAMDHEDVIEFGPFRLMPARRLLTRDDMPIPLGDRAFDILLTLIDEAPAVVDRSTLIQRVWSDLFVDETNLRFQIHELRKALDDGAPGERYIATVQRRGYSFVGQISRAPSKGSPPDDRVDTASPLETNLRQYLTRIVGRDAELAELQTYLFQHRLVTLVGPGGVGKTRLAVELGWRVLPDFPGGVWLVDLAPLTDPVAVVRTTASVVRAMVANDATAVAAIAAALGKRRRLLIFDNCEHLAAAAAELIQALLARLPALTVLTTTQQAVEIAGEQVYRLTPLCVPPVGAIEIDDFGAADLFVERACAADTSFALDARSRAGVAEICRRLDGLPLALEMGAARLKLLGVDGLLDGLDDRLRLLKGPQRTAEARHGSLQALVEWSHGLLEPGDQQLFRRLAVFPGSFTLDAAVAVGIGDDIDRWDVVDALGRLVDRSLVTIDRGLCPRYRLLETLRLYAGVKLRNSGERDAVAERHARHVAEALDRAYLAWETMPDAEWEPLYQPEVDNLRAALDWAFAEPGRSAIALALGASGMHLFRALSLISEGLRSFERLVPLIDEDTPPALAAGVLKHAMSFPRDIPAQRVLAYLERAASLYRELADAPILGVVLSYIGEIELRMDRYEQAREHLAEAAKLLERSSFKKSQILTHARIGTVAMCMGRIAEARTCFNQMLDVCSGSSLGPRATAHAANSLAMLEYIAGNVDRAVELGRVAVRASRATPSLYLAYTLSCLADYLLTQGNPGEARGFLEDAFERFGDAGTISGGELQTWAVLGSAEGRLADAARLIGFVDAEDVRIQEPRPKTKEQLYGQLSRRLEAGLPPDELASLKDEGARWTKVDALGFVERRLLPPPSQQELTAKSGSS